MMIISEDAIDVCQQLFNSNGNVFIDLEVAHYKTTPTLSLIQFAIVSQEEEELNNQLDVDWINKLSDRIVILDVYKKRDVIAWFIHNVIQQEKYHKWFHNSPFDLKYLGGIEHAKNVTCTLALSKSIPYHLLSTTSYSLDNLMQYFIKGKQPELYQFLKYDNKELLQSSDNWHVRPLSEEQIEYAILDVLNLYVVYYYLKELEHKVNLENANNDIQSLEERLSTIDREYKSLNSQYEALSSKLKQTMIEQNVKESKYFKLSSYNRSKSKTIPFNVLANASIQKGVQLEFPVTITQKISVECDKKGINIEELLGDTESSDKVQVYRLLNKK
jgi:ribonuclease D